MLEILLKDQYDHEILSILRIKNNEVKLEEVESVIQEDFETWRTEDSPKSFMEYLKDKLPKEWKATLNTERQVNEIYI